LRDAVRTSEFDVSTELVRTVEVPAPPDEVALDSLEVSRDAGALHEADARMFAGNADYQAESFETFRDEHLAGDDLVPELSLVARSGGRVVGFTLCRATGRGVGVVDLLAVDNPPALALYAAVSMRVAQRTHVFEKPLSPD
jgi:hypothetical protein